MTNWRARVLRAMLRVAGRALLHVLARPSISGARYLRTEGPVIYAANHASTFDALLFFILLPPDTTFVGPGDFRLLWPGEWLIAHLGLIRARRGAVDREGMKRMTAVLKAGGRLALFPEGGTWEKPIDDVKPGAAYLSQATGARIVPIGFGGTYQAWDAIFRLKRPAIAVRVGPPLSAVALPADRKGRQDALQAESVVLMWRIYDLLPQDTQAHYDRIARQRFHGRLAFDPPAFDPPTGAPPGVSFDALAELILKPNLFSPLHRNAGLPLAPFLHPGRFYPPGTMKLAAQSLLDAFADGDYAGYLEYRLGEDKADRIRAALRAIVGGIDGLPASGARVAFVASVEEAAGPARSG